VRDDGPLCVCVGDRIEVFWEHEGEWFGGEVIQVDKSDDTFRVCYFLDDTRMWHGQDWDVRAMKEE